MTGIIIGALVVAALGALVAGFYFRMRALKPEVDAAKQAFFEQVGYAFGGPMALRKGVAPFTVTTPDGVITFRSDTWQSGGKQLTTQSWTLHPVAPPPATFQLIEKRLMGTLQSLKNLVGPTARTVTVQFPGPHTIDDAELEARFTLYAAEPQYAQEMLGRHDVKSELLGLTEVMLIVEPSEMVFSDPSDANLWAAYRAAGLSRTALNPAPMIRVGITVHQAVHRLLRALTRSH